MYFQGDIVSQMMISAIDARFVQRNSSKKINWLDTSERTLEKSVRHLWTMNTFHFVSNLFSFLFIAFKCPFCSERAYAQKGDLTKHIKLKHVGNKVYNCDICQEGFQYFVDLKTHTFEHYKKDKVKQDTASQWKLICKKFWIWKM